MERAIYKTLVAFVLVAATHIILAFLADGTTDQYYQKFILPNSKNLIFGTSRASQGLNPTVLNECLGKQDFQNFAFTLLSSPFGEVYTNAIKNKISTIDSGGYFIVAVDPWSISKWKGKSVAMADSRSILSEIEHFDRKPNLEYLWFKYSCGWGMIAYRKFEKFVLKSNHRFFNRQVNGSFAEVNRDGYLRVYPSLDSSFVALKENRTFGEYLKKSKEMELSSERIESLKKLIQLLNSKGKVFLVRLPVHEKMYGIEKHYMNDFDDRILELLAEEKYYINMTDSIFEHTYIDGNHLYYESALDVSQRLAFQIKARRN